MKTKRKSLLAIALCAVGLAAFAEPVSYLDWDDANKKMTNAVCTEYTVVKADTATFDAGTTYVVKGDVTNKNSRITVNGTAANPTRLILCDGAKLTAPKGIEVRSEGSLTNALVICGQAEGTGALEVTETSDEESDACIGGKYKYACGIVTINGGSLTLSGYTFSAGIGSGEDSDDGGIITINGGTIVAKGGADASGIGGSDHSPGCTVVINGGVVMATGKDTGAGIGGGGSKAGGSVTINGGIVCAVGGDWGAAGIGGGFKGAGGDVTINGGTVTATGGDGSVGDGGVGDGGVGIGGGEDAGIPGTVTFGAGFNVVTGETAAVTAPIAQDDYVNDHSAKYVHIELAPTVVAQFVKGGEVVAEFATAEAAVAALDDAQYADIEEFRIGLAADTVFDFGGRTNRVVILNVGDVENTLKNVLLDCAEDYVVTGMVGTVVFGDGVRIEKETGFKVGPVALSIKGGLYKSDPSFYCEDGSFGARRSNADAALNGLYAILPEAEIAVTESPKKFVTIHYATLQDAFNLIGENEEVTLRLFNNLELGTAVTKLEGNKVIHLLPSESGANTIKRVGAEPVIEIGRGAKLEISDVIFDGANVTSEKPMIEVAGKTGTNFGWLIAGDGFVVSNAVGGAVHVGNGGKFELDGVAKIIENTTDGKPKNVVIEDSNAILLKACGAVTDGNYAQIGVSSDNDKFMVAGGQFGTVDTSYEYATDFADGDISVAEPKVGFINDRDGTLHHAAGAKIAAAGKKTYKRWVGGEYKELVEEGDYLISRESKFPSSPTYLPELIWTARQEAPAAQPAPAVLDWTDATLTLSVENGCDYALVTGGSAETNWISMVKTDNTYAFARPAGDDYLCLRRYSITPSNIVSAATAYSVRIPAGTEDDPWTVGGNIVAYTNGTELVIGGAGTVPDLSKLASKVTAQKLTIKDARVTGAESEAFKSFSDVSLTLPNGWQGELPKGGVWYGATVTLTAMPPAVKNVTFQQRYPWNGLVDVGFTLMGPAGETNVVVTAYTNGTVKIADFTAAVTIPADGVLATNLVWNAAAAGLAANFKSDDVTVEVAFAGETPQPGQLWKGGPIFAECNVGATKPGDYGELYTFYGNKAADAAASLGDGWRLPTKTELEGLLANCTKNWETCKDSTGADRAGYRFTGKGDYSLHSIFLPAAGIGDGSGRGDAGDYVYYWSSEARDFDDAWDLNNGEGGDPVVYNDYILFGMSVRAVRDASKSKAGALDLTVGDRVAKDTEMLVVDPACGETTTATVAIDFGGETVDTRTYTCATNDTWDTTELTPGRYTLALTVGAETGDAAFWKTGADWGVFDSSNITADVTFEAGKTYLFFGTNTADGATLTVLDGAKFFYDEGAPAGFKSASVAELPKRYEIADGVDPADESKLFQIVEKIKGCADNPWEIGEGVEAYTNGNELVIGGAGTVSDLSKLAGKVTVDALAIEAATVTVAEADAFAGLDNIALTLPDGWQGELPDGDGNWYGAKNVTLTAMPLAVKNVISRQRYPWNGLVDIACDLTGAGTVALNATVLTNGAEFIEAQTFIGETTVDLDAADGVKNGVKFVWDAAADLPAGFKAQNITLKVTVEKLPPPPPPVTVAVMLRYSTGDDVRDATLNIGGTSVNILNGAGSVDIVPGTYSVSVSGDDIDTTSLSPTSVTIAEGTGILNFTVSPPPPPAPTSDNFETMALEQLADGKESLNQADNMFNRYSSSKDTMYLDQAAGFAGQAVTALDVAKTMATSSTTISQEKKDEINTYLNQAKTLKEQIDAEKQE